MPGSVPLDVLRDIAQDAVYSTALGHASWLQEKLGKSAYEEFSHKSPSQLVDYVMNRLEEAGADKHQIQLVRNVMMHADHGETGVITTERVLNDEGKFETVKKNGHDFDGGLRMTFEEMKSAFVVAGLMDEGQNIKNIKQVTMETEQYIKSIQLGGKINDIPSPQRYLTEMENPSQIPELAQAGFDFANKSPELCTKFGWTGMEEQKRLDSWNTLDEGSQNKAIMDWMIKAYGTEIDPKTGAAASIFPEDSDYNEKCQIVLKEFYMDNTVNGHNTLPQTLQNIGKIETTHRITENYLHKNYDENFDYANSDIKAMIEKQDPAAVAADPASFIAKAFEESFQNGGMSEYYLAQDNTHKQQIQEQQQNITVPTTSFDDPAVQTAEGPKTPGMGN